MTVVYCKATRNVDDGPNSRLTRTAALTGVSAGVVYGDNASMDCCIVNRETLLEMHRPLPGRRLSGPARGTPGRLWQHRRVAATSTRARSWACLAKSLYRRSMDLLDQTVADQLFDPERPMR